MDRVTSISKAEDKAVETFNQYKSKPEFIVRSVMQGATGYPFYNLSKLEFRPSQKGINSLLDDPSIAGRQLRFSPFADSRFLKRSM